MRGGCEAGTAWGPCAGRGERRRVTYLSMGGSVTRSPAALSSGQWAEPRDVDGLSATEHSSRPTQGTGRGAGEAHGTPAATEQRRAAPATAGA